MMNGYALAALLPFIELDSALVGQFMLGRPLVVGSLFGLALGKAAEGLMIGAVLEAFSAEEPPVGGRIPLNHTVAAGVALILPLPPAAALPGALLAGWIHAMGEQVLRQKRAFLAAPTQGSWAPVIGRSLALQAVWTAVVTLASVVVLAPLLAWLWTRAPMALRSGLELAWAAAPWLAVATLLKAFRRAV